MVVLSFSSTTHCRRVHPWQGWIKENLTGPWFTLTLEQASVQKTTWKPKVCSGDLAFKLPLEMTRAKWGAEQLCQASPASTHPSKQGHKKKRSSLEAATAGPGMRDHGKLPTAPSKQVFLQKCTQYLERYCILHRSGRSVAWHTGKTEKWKSVLLLINNLNA